MTEIHYNVRNTREDNIGLVLPPDSNRTAILQEADRIIKGDRHNAYGPAEHTFNKIARYWSEYLNITIQASDVAKMMILMKVARASHGYKLDNYIDIAGYAALGGEIEADEASLDNNVTRG